MRPQPPAPSLPRLVVLLLLLAGCGEEAADESGSKSSQRDGLPFRSFYEEVQSHIHDYLFQEGDWTEDFGDAAYYGPAFLVRAGERYGRPDYSEQAVVAHERNLEVLRRARADLVYFFGALEEVPMAALGVIEVLAATGSQEGLAELDGLVDLLDQTVEGFGIYLNLPIESYALSTYGPTSVTGLVAMLNLRYAELLDTEREADRLAFGLKVIAAIDDQAWTGSTYRFVPDSDQLYLYPNVTMIIANAAAFRLTGEQRFLERCQEIHDGIQPLRDPQKKAYRSPYSAQYMGARTDDYFTLSSQNYTMTALALLHEITGDPAYRREYEDEAAFIQHYLYREGRILHHWMDGRVAVPEDPEYFCSGCNLQFLYVSLYGEEHLYGAPAPAR
ncbi:MAG: hypothetical protein FJ125_07955 [Deltaproteobacteria bacterium]|nr:hypothetical protein [Deltaproteobacteria bacterium]